jgi:hypothetical protein
MPRHAKQPTFISRNKPDYNVAAELLATIFHKALVARNQISSEEALCEKLSSTCDQARTVMMYQ